MKKKITEAVRKTLSPGDIIQVSLDPAVGSETQKHRPCVVVSAQPLHAVSRTILVVPITSGDSYIMRLCPTISTSQSDCGVTGTPILPQMRAIDPVARNAYLIGTITDTSVIEQMQINLAAMLGISVGLLEGE